MWRKRLTLAQLIAQMKALVTDRITHFLIYHDGSCSCPVQPVTSVILTTLSCILPVLFVSFTTSLFPYFTMSWFFFLFFFLFPALMIYPFHNPFNSLRKFGIEKWFDPSGGCSGSKAGTSPNLNKHSCSNLLRLEGYLHGPK